MELTSSRPWVICGTNDPTIAAMATLLIALTVVLVLLVERFIGLEKFMTLD
jgi:ABC-type spermidine/putrescine transport system permease subunit II